MTQTMTTGLSLGTETLLTQTLKARLTNPVSSPEFDLHAGLNDVLSDVGMTASDSGGKLTFYGQDPIVPSPIRFGSMAAIGLAAKAVGVAALWRARTGEGQDISVDVRKALRRFCCFFEGKWETMNGRPPAMGADEDNPFLKLPLFRETRDGRHVVPLNFYPGLRTRTLDFLRCRDSAESVENAGALELFSPRVSCIRLLPSECARYTCVSDSLFSPSITGCVSVHAANFPSGDGTAAVTVFTFIESSGVH